MLPNVQTPKTAAPSGMDNMRVTQDFGNSNCGAMTLVVSVPPYHVLEPVDQRIGDVKAQPSPHAEVLQSKHRDIREDAEARDLGELRTYGPLTPATATTGRVAQTGLNGHTGRELTSLDELRRQGLDMSCRERT